ncbi:thioredoxin domain-containing protein [Halopenitus persicus]|uniref:Protein-disulfide isomerase n=1 Tax=Halopenitus persicus TaxID=1048396 RepID=A0A1H3K496_9EURY|nr:thioredoxin domain-containing protein [Halopenitus persicus]SDY46575.1 Protein-disulfide isomerase [Halopenitus persicus]
MRTSRRAVLSSVGTAASIGVAGCLGGGGGSGIPDYDCDTSSSTDSVSELPRPVIGDPEADVTVAVFKDFACPHCATWELEESPTIESEYVDPGIIRYEHWDFPIPVHDTWSPGVANAARGVQDRQGDEAFFAFAKTAFEHHESYSWDIVGYAAEEAGGDPCSAIRDGESGTYEAVVSADREAGVGRGVQGTPTVFVNGEPVSAPTADAVSTAIENAR